MNIIGLTGHSGSGKTTVANIMSECGFYHINCDKLVHERVYSNPRVLTEISDVFGEKYIIDGKLNRPEFANLVFSDKNAYNKLMELIKPYIFAELEKEIQLNSEKNILLDAPTLFEFGIQDMCSKIIGVISKNPIERICERDGISIEAAKLRLSNQKNAGFYKENCDIIIENDYDINSLNSETKTIANNILKGIFD